MTHGRRKGFFQGGDTRRFFQTFSEGAKVVKFDFSHSKPRKQPFVLKFSKSRRRLGPPLPPSSDAHAPKHVAL